MRARYLLPCLLLLAPAAAAAPATILYAGTLEGPSGPVDETISAVFTLFDEETAGSAVFSQTEASFEVVGGALVVEIGRAGDLEEDDLGDRTLFLEVSVNGNTLAPRARIEPHPVAYFAHGADHAPLAHAASLVGTLTAAEAVGFEELATTGGASVAYGHLTGFPAGFVDGDQGIDFTPSTQFNFSAGTLALAAASITSAELQDGAVGTSEIAAGAVTSTALATGAVNSAKLAVGAVWDSNIANGAITSRVIGQSGASQQRRAYRIDTAACVEEVGTLTFDDACTPGPGSCSAGYTLNCVGSCVSIMGGNFPTCPNTAVGWVVYAP